MYISYFPHKFIHHFLLPITSFLWSSLNHLFNGGRAQIIGGCEEDQYISCSPAIIPSFLLLSLSVSFRFANFRLEVSNNQRPSIKTSSRYFSQSTSFASLTPVIYFNYHQCSSVSISPSIHQFFNLPVHQSSQVLSYFNLSSLLRFIIL